MATISVTGFDHLVVRCSDVETSLAWYTGVLGLQGLRVDEWHRGEVFFPSARIDEGTIIDFVTAVEGRPAGRNVDHLCLVVAPGVVEAVAAEPNSYRIVDGPSVRWGARGNATSIYILDPDDNVIELRTYPT